MANKKLDFYNSVAALDILMVIAADAGDPVELDMENNKITKLDERSGSDLFSNEDLLKKYSTAKISRITRELAKYGIISVKENTKMQGKPKKYSFNDKGFSKFVSKTMKKHQLSLAYKGKKFVMDKLNPLNDAVGDKIKDWNIQNANSIDVFLNSVIFDAICNYALWSGVSTLYDVVQNAANIILNLWGLCRSREDFESDEIKDSKEEFFEDILETIKPEFKEAFKGFVAAKKEINRTNRMKLDLVEYRMNLEDFLTGEVDYLMM